LSFFLAELPCVVFNLLCEFNNTDVPGNLASLMQAEKEHFMNSLNPFVPSITLIKVPRRDQRERFRKVVFGVLAAQLVFILALLLNHGRSEAASPEIASASISLASANASDHPAAAPPAVVQSNPATTVPSEIVMPAPLTQTREPYVIKSGDTLSSIARACGSTVKALRSVNSLANDRLVVGQKLRLPESRVQIASVTRPL
jgi:LysM repeat protein